MGNNESEFCHNCLFLEPFFGGSHREFAEGLISHSRHRWELLTLPGRFWKWRMRGASLSLLRKLSNIKGSWNVLMVTDLMSVSDLKALWPGQCPPILLYFHESQFTYPLAEGERLDMQYGFTDITSALAADQVLFNSNNHKAEFLKQGAQFLERMPDKKPYWVLESIASKSNVVFPGCRFPAGPLALKSLEDTGSPPLIIWNHRWEFDKGPAQFFRVLDQVAARGIRFRLALLGERYQNTPAAFEKGCQRYADHIVQYGFVGDRAKYLEWLGQGAVVISTAIQENFGMSVVEAIRYGCFPLLPDRLSYPEILPEVMHPLCLYTTEGELVEKLCHFLTFINDYALFRNRLSQHMAGFSWKTRIDRFDAILTRLAGAKHPSVQKN